MITPLSVNLLMVFTLFTLITLFTILTCLNWLESLCRGSVSNTSAMEDEQMSAPLLAPAPGPPGLLWALERGLGWPVSR